MIIEYIEFWIILTVIFLLMELLTRRLYCLSLALGCCCVAILTYFNYSVNSRIIALLVVTVVCIIISRPIAKKIKENKKPNFLIDKLIGEEGIVKDYLNKNTIGTIQVNGKNWNAITNEELLEGTLVTVVGADGKNLVVEKKL